MRTTQQTPCRLAPHTQDRGGFALPAAMAVLVLLSVLVVTVFANSMASFRSGNTDLGKSQSHFAAEAGAESAMAQLADALEDAVLEDAELTMIVEPTMPNFVFDSFSVVKVGGVVPERITNGPFTGLWSLTQLVDVHSEASDLAGNSSAVMVTAKAQAIPIFQFGVFYEKDLEIHNGPRLDFAGWVHSNGNIYLNSNNQYFQDLVTTPNKVFHDRKDSHDVDPGVWIQDATATDVLLTFDSRDTPNPNDFRSASNLSFDNRLQTDAYNVDSLRVPLPTGMTPEKVIEERLITDGALEVQAKMAHKADLYLQVPLTAIAGNPADLCDEMMPLAIRDDPTHVLPTIAECGNIFELEFNAFWDKRQNRGVDMFNINMDELFAWAGTDVTRVTNIIYVYFTGVNGGPPNNDYPAVRLRRGAALGNPITIASKHPMYVQGDYNNVGWQPSAIIGDALTLLSNAWNDANTPTQGSARPPAADTEYYAAILAGHSPTPCDHEDVGCPGGNYGGGLENYLRFLEGWGGGTRAFYRGSLVSLHFTLQVPEGNWACCGYYQPPNRDWAFDMRFEDPANLPPGTPVVGNVIHTAFRPLY